VVLVAYVMELYQPVITDATVFAVKSLFVFQQLISILLQLLFGASH
jgi:hypothetical protein